MNMPTMMPLSDAQSTRILIAYDGTYTVEAVAIAFVTDIHQCTSEQFNLFIRDRLYCPETRHAYAMKGTCVSLPFRKVTRRAVRENPYLYGTQGGKYLP